MTTKDRLIGLYVLGYFPTALILFWVLWIYSVFAWGAWTGVLIGWLPALIGAALLACLWPLALVALGFLLIALL